MFLKRLSVSSRFLIVLAIGFIFQAGISAVSLVNLKHSMRRDRTSEVKHLLETAYSTVVFYHDQAAQGLMTDDAARKAAADAVRAMRYDNNNYFFIWDLNGVGIAHGAHPEWEGRNLLQSPDKDKLPVVSYMVSRLIEACRGGSKEGATSYRIAKFGRTEPIEKIAYTKLFEPWGWAIGTGAYVDDIDDTFRSQAISLLSVFLGLIGVAGLFTFLLGRDLSQALTRLAARVASVAKGELDGGVPETGRRDEVGVMARALLVLRDNSREAVELRLDQLTGLPNRKMLLERVNERLNQAAADSSRGGSYAVLMLLDMDKFKSLNDNHGHEMGDLLLKEVARRLLACVRKGDTVARLGGDEFVVFVADIGHKQEEAAAVAQGLAEKILTALNQPFDLADVSHANSASAGITLFNGASASAEELLKQADLAMYKCKGSGRNAFRLFDPIMEVVAHERAALEADLRLAITERQLQLHYQPQLWGDGSLKGAEALLRWTHPQRGPVSPVAFIPIAEETGVILTLGQWVLETACRQMAAWAESPETAGLKIAVNVSVIEFQQPGFVDRLMATLAATGANPERLELELTESVLVADVDTVIEKMLAVRALGVSFALDDFGTGYSSLSYLKRMPLDHVKIDRSFVRDLLVDPNDAAIARTIIALARTLGLCVIAEGVETAEQLDFLARSGCDVYQGYLFSRPLPLASFETFVRQTARRADQSLRQTASPRPASQVVAWPEGREDMSPKDLPSEDLAAQDLAAEDLATEDLAAEDLAAETMAHGLSGRRRSGSFG